MSNYDEFRFNFVKTAFKENNGIIKKIIYSFNVPDKFHSYDSNSHMFIHLLNAFVNNILNNSQEKIEFRGESGIIESSHEIKFEEINLIYYVYDNKIYIKCNEWNKTMNEFIQLLYRFELKYSNIIS